MRQSAQKLLNDLQLRWSREEYLAAFPGN